MRKLIGRGSNQCLQKILRYLAVLFWAQFCWIGVSAQTIQKVGLEDEAETRQQTKFEASTITSKFAAKTTTTILTPGQKHFVTGASGTVAMVDASMFVHQDGSPIGGPIEFVLKEVNSKAGLIIENLPTMAGDSLLYSGGVVHLEATSEGKPLKLAAGKVIELQFEEKDPKMILFGGVADTSGMVNWVPMPPPSDPANSSVNSEFATDLKSSGSGKGAPSYDEAFTMDDAALLAKITPMAALGTIDNQTQKFSKSRTFVSKYILQTLKAEYPCVGSENLDVHIEFSRQGTPTRIQITSAKTPCFQRAVVEIVSQLRWTSIDGHRAVTVQLNINQPTTGNPNENSFVSMADNPASQLDETTRKALQQLNQIQNRRIEERRIRNFARDAMHATDLGWINLDAYVRNRDNVAIDANIVGAPPGTSVFLVIDEFRAVMPSKGTSIGKAEFTGVPKGLSAKIVALSANAETGISIGVLPIQTEQGNAGKLEMKRVTEQELIQKLEVL
jgi:hypothetical protein